AFTPDGKRMAAVLSDGDKRRIHVWSMVTGEELLSDTDDNRFVCDNAAFSPDGKHLVVSFNGAGLFCWDVAAGRRLWHDKDNYAEALAVTPGGKVIFRGGTLKVPELDLRTGRPTRELRLPKLWYTRQLLVTPDGRRLLESRNDGVPLAVWDLKTG